MYMHSAAIIILLLAGAGMAQGVSSLAVGDATYENVTLKNEYPRSFFIQHDGGTAFIERSKLTEDQIAQLLEASTARESVNGNESAEPEVRAENKEAEYLHPKPESLETDEEKKFFEACRKADTATIVSMLKENPALAKVTMRGQSLRRIWVQDEMRTEPVDASCDALQWLIDESEKTPDRIEAIKALVEAGADPSRTTSEAGSSMARNSVSIPSKLTIEELDFLLSKGANPDFGFCATSR